MSERHLLDPGPKPHSAYHRLTGPQIRMGARNKTLQSRRGGLLTYVGGHQGVIAGQPSFSRQIRFSFVVGSTRTKAPSSINLRPLSSSYECDLPIFHHALHHLLVLRRLLVAAALHAAYLPVIIGFWDGISHGVSGLKGRLEEKGRGLC